MQTIKFFLQHPSLFFDSIRFIIRSLPRIITSMLKGEQITFHIIELPAEHNFIKEDGTRDHKAINKFILDNYDKE